MSEPTSPRPSMTVEEKKELERKQGLLRVMTVSGILVCLLFLVLMVIPAISSPWPYIVTFALLLISCVLAFFLNRAGRFVLASSLFIVSLMLAILIIVVMGIFVQEVLGFVVYYLPLTVLVAGMLLGSRVTFGVAALDAVLIVAVSLLALVALEMDPETFVDDVVAVAIPAVVLCFLMALVAGLYGRSLEGALRQLTEQSQQLRAANEEIRAFSRTLEGKVEERTQELREFVSMVAHDLRGPLTVIGGYAEVLEEDLTADPRERPHRAIHTISTNAEQMLSMTDDLLEISRLQSGAVQFHMEPVAIDLVIEEVCASFARQVQEKQLGLKLELPAKLPRVWGDHIRLTQVLNNLVGNAYNYTPSGAIIVGARPVDGQVEIRVADTGIGIPPEEQKRLFTHFFRGEHEVVREQEGTGLGLSIARSIVEAHGGEMWVESEMEKGTTFHFTVPVATGALLEGTGADAPPNDD